MTTLPCPECSHGILAFDSEEDGYSWDFRGSTTRDCPRCGAELKLTLDGVVYSVPAPKENS